ncbi:hypothetical protein ILUMI_23339 [Ignelater luminosus]|uniref:FYVE-type domain-containing protein n=1 Tax=Ignelater luminosus TaxID=2038154 RepID=A0A8K0CCM7_IGNLU|nr:hypothetical protein ILUMI_23339 [Ignelater luminosus]
MDKYTVDIDKVLNDFEYSELTDQYSGGSTSQNSNIHASTNHRQDPYKLRSTPVKHTINNVFQSLNEYLNTDIGVKSKQNESNDNNAKDTNLPRTQESLLNTSTQYFPIALSNSNTVTSDVTKIDEDEKSYNTNETSKTIPSENNCLENISIVNSNNTLETHDNEIEDVNEPQLNDEKPKKETNSMKIDLDSSKSEEVTEKENTVSEDDVEKIQTLPDVIDNVSIKLSEQIKEQEEIISTLKESSPELENDLKEQPVVVGFDDSFGLNDSELHQYLDELESEYEIKNRQIENELKTEDNQMLVTDLQQNEPTINIKVPSIEVIVNESNDLESNNQETECNVDDTSLPRPSSLQINNQTQIDLIGEPGSTPYNNVYVAETLPVTEPAPESDTESTSSTSPTFSDVSTDTAASTASTESVTDSIENKIVSRTESEITPISPTQNDTEVNVTLVDSNNALNNVMNLENISNNNMNSNENFNVANEISENASGNATVSEVLVTSNENEDVEVKNDDNGQSDSSSANIESNQQETALEQNMGPSNWLGKQAPLWIPDSEALNCLHCDSKFTVIKRRHHCRACGLVLCSKCCNMRHKLEYLDAEARVCLKCYDILNKDTNSSSGSEVSPSSGNSPNRQLNQPNPNNPMEYCSMVPPLQQVSGVSQNPPTVMVPVGVLKRKGSSKSRTNKSVMFCDGIRPGSELTNLDNDFNYNESRSSGKKGSSPPPPKVNRNTPAIDANTKSFIPNAENCLPPTVTVFKSDISYTECANNSSVVEMLRNEPLTFALQSNLHVHVKIINMDCCISKWAWCFSTEGMISVGQDEVVLLLEFVDNDKIVPKDIFFHLNNTYNDAKKGSSITEYGISLHTTNNFLESKNHIGFLYIRPTFQCLQNVIIPKEPYLIGILIHRWEMPWAKIFPLRLILRLGAEYRYYPSPIISTRHRESVFVEIGHTIINLLADFRNFSYTLPNIRGLAIHMEEKNTTVTIPSNRYDQVMKSLNNSSDHILAFGGNFSVNADSHLVCIQDTHGNNENTYTTHAINIHNRPRKVTGASFIVFNGALKSSSGLTAKSSIVEDGLMIQIPPEHMLQIRESLRNMKNYTIQCGCINATSDETVNIVWGDNDVNFNMGIQSSIDNQSLSGIPSIRVHNGKDYVCNSGNRMIRWTEVFILQNGDENARGQDVDFSKLAESISKATCQALVKYLDLLSSNNFYKIGIRTTLHVENVSYSAGSNGMKLPPIYMKSLDNELIPVLHRITSNNLGESAIVLELVFRILNV